MKQELLKYEWLNIYGDPGYTYEEIINYFSEKNIRHMFGKYNAEEANLACKFALQERGF